RGGRRLAGGRARRRRCGGRGPMNGRRVLAWLNLAYRFAAHVLRMPVRPFMRGREAARFLDAVAPEGYTPLRERERAGYPALMSCVSCGLCALACPALRDAPASAWSEAMAFVTGPARSIDRAPLAAADVPACMRCDACVDVCPTDVPIPRLAALVERLAEEGGASQPPPAPVRGGPDADG
ncbi:MAG: 4Fe-4S dicluster domain-containing protein, partial [Gemmatimonadota bacterium]